jgi:hypothetical protein
LQVARAGEVASLQTFGDIHQADESNQLQDGPQVRKKIKIIKTIIKKCFLVIGQKIFGHFFK